MSALACGPPASHVDDSGVSTFMEPKSLKAGSPAASLLTARSVEAFRMKDAAAIKQSV